MNRLEELDEIIEIGSEEIELCGRQMTNETQLILEARIELANAYQHIDALLHPDIIDPKELITCYEAMDNLVARLLTFRMRAIMNTDCDIF